MERADACDTDDKNNITKTIAVAEDNMKKKDLTERKIKYTWGSCGGESADGSRKKDE